MAVSSTGSFKCDLCVVHIHGISNFLLMSMNQQFNESVFHILCDKQKQINLVNHRIMDSILMGNPINALTKSPVQKKKKNIISLPSMKT